MTGATRTCHAVCITAFSFLLKQQCSTRPRHIPTPRGSSIESQHTCRTLASGGRGKLQAGPRTCVPCGADGMVALVARLAVTVATRPQVRCRSRQFRCWRPSFQRTRGQERKEVIPALTMALDFCGLAIREAIVGGDDADRRPAVVKSRRPESTAKLQSKLCTVARRNRLEDVNGPLQRVDKS